MNGSSVKQSTVVTRKRPCLNVNIKRFDFEFRENVYRKKNAFRVMKTPDLAWKRYIEIVGKIPSREAIDLYIHIYIYIANENYIGIFLLKMTSMAIF